MRGAAGLGERETTGFQREVNPKRLESLRKFFGNPNNVIQNPLLCAARAEAQGRVSFVADEHAGSGYSRTGTVKIEVQELESWTLLQLLKAVKADIERRAPHLKDQPIPHNLVLDLKNSLSDQPVEVSEGDDSAETTE